MNQSRHPAGTPVGGRFAPTNRPEPVGIELVDDDLVEAAGDDTARTVLSEEMLDGFESDPRWLGSGYLDARKHMTSKVQKMADEVVLKIAAEQDLDAEQLFYWCNSPEGRRFGEVATDYTDGAKLEERARDWCGASMNYRTIMEDRTEYMPGLEPEEGHTINLSAELIGRCGNHFRRGAYGPEGFTIDAAPALQRFTSQRYVPLMYWDHPFKPDKHYVNGEMGLFYFSGADGEAATELLAKLPAKCLENRQNAGPTLRSILSAARDHPEIVFGGYIVGPERTDERVSVDTVFFDTDDKNEADVCRRVRALFHTRGTPDEVMRYPAPGHPSKEVWRVWWD